MHRIFIAGSPRSGTTLAQQYLQSDQRLLSFPETHFLKVLHPKQLGNLMPGYLLKNRAVRKIQNYSGLELTLSGLTKSSIIHSIVQNFDKLALENNCLGWIEKTPAHLNFILKYWKQLFPEAVIIVLRDPVPTINSLYVAANAHSNQWLGKNTTYRSLTECAQIWSNSIIKADVIRRVKNEHVILINYETLLHEDAAIKKLQKAGLNVSHRCIDANVIINNEPWKDNNLKPLKASGNNQNYQHIISLINPEIYRKFVNLKKIASDD